MKSNKSLLVGLAMASPFLIASFATEAKVTFAPDEGVTLTKTYTLTQLFAVDDMSMSMGGNEFPMEMEMDLSVTQVTAVQDTYDKMGEGKPAKLTRLFKDASMEMESETVVSMPGTDGEAVEVSGSGTSQLKGKKVIFTWDAEKGEYTKKYDEETEGDEAFLTELVEDTDLRGFLPDKAVSEGDEWTVENDMIIEMLGAGGNWQWKLEGMDNAAQMGAPDAEMMSDLRLVLGETLEGSITCTYAGMKEKDGTEYMAIKIVVDVQSENDLTDYMAEVMESVETPIPIAMDIEEMTMTMDLAGKATLFWNGEAGHMHAFDYEGEFNMGMNMSMSVEAQGTQEIAMEMEMSGEMGLKVDTSK